MNLRTEANNYIGRFEGASRGTSGISYGEKIKVRRHWNYN